MHALVAAENENHAGGQALPELKEKIGATTVAAAVGDVKRHSELYAKSTTRLKAKGMAALAARAAQAARLRAGDGANARGEEEEVDDKDALRVESLCTSAATKGQLPSTSQSKTAQRLSSPPRWM